MLRGNRGQHLGEYAVTVGVVASAMIGAQLLLSKGAARGLVTVSHAMLGTPPEAQAKPSTPTPPVVASRCTPGATRSLLTTESCTSEDGTMQRVVTTSRTASMGSNTSGSILADPYGPSLGEVVIFNQPFSSVQLASELGQDYTVTDLIQGPDGLISAVLKTDDGETALVMGLPSELAEKGLLIDALEARLTDEARKALGGESLWDTSLDTLRRLRRSLGEADEGSQPPEAVSADDIARWVEANRHSANPITVADGKLVELDNGRKAWNMSGTLVGSQPDDLPDAIASISRDQGWADQGKFQAIRWFVVDRGERDRQLALPAEASRPSWERVMPDGTPVARVPAGGEIPRPTRVAVPMPDQTLSLEPDPEKPERVYELRGRGGLEGTLTYHGRDAKTAVFQDGRLQNPQDFAPGELHYNVWMTPGRSLKTPIGTFTYHGTTPQTVSFDQSGRLLNPQDFKEGELRHNIEPKQGMRIGDLEVVDLAKWRGNEQKRPISIDITTGRVVLESGEETEGLGRYAGVTAREAFAAGKHPAEFANADVIFRGKPEALPQTVLDTFPTYTAERPSGPELSAPGGDPAHDRDINPPGPGGSVP